ncbi:MAG: hypothetical protein GC179_26390 [Anaerolineaceae bacterium]|nr:hypothetical protein [Anaerolineaceae bacterium]
MKRFLAVVLLAVLGVSFLPAMTKVVTAQGGCGGYLTVSVDNISSGMNIVVLWTTAGSLSSAGLSREFFNGQTRANAASEIYSNLEGVGSKEFTANAQGYSEHYTLTATYQDGTTQITTCVVTVNSPQSTQVVSFSVLGRNATVPGSTHQIGWETRNVSQIQLLALNPQNQQVILKSNLPPKGLIEFTIPANYTYSSLQLILQLDQIAVSDLPSAAILKLPINLSGGSQPNAEPPAQTGSVTNLRLIDWREVAEATYQEFENGVMFWLPGVMEQPVLVMYNDGTWQFGQWQEFEAGITDTPPANRYTPSLDHAFGKVWAQNPAVRGKLGWGLQPESSASVEVRIYGSVWLIRMPDGTTRLGQDLTGSQSWAVVK